MCWDEEEWCHHLPVVDVYHQCKGLEAHIWYITNETQHQTRLCNWLIDHHLFLLQRRNELQTSRSVYIDCSCKAIVREMEGGLFPSAVLGSGLRDALAYNMSLTKLFLWGVLKGRHLTSMVSPIANRQNRITATTRRECNQLSNHQIIIYLQVISHQRQAEEKCSGNVLSAGRWHGAAKAKYLRQWW